MIMESQAGELKLSIRGHAGVLGFLMGSQLLGRCISWLWERDEKPFLENFAEDLTSYLFWISLLVGGVVVTYLVSRVLWRRGRWAKKLVDEAVSDLTCRKAWRDLAKLHARKDAWTASYLIYYFSQHTRSGAISAETIEGFDWLSETERGQLLELYGKSMAEPPFWETSWGWRESV